MAASANICTFFWRTFHDSQFNVKSTIMWQRCIQENCYKRKYFFECINSSAMQSFWIYYEYYELHRYLYDYIWNKLVLHVSFVAKEDSPLNYVVLTPRNVTQCKWNLLRTFFHISLILLHKSCLALPLHYKMFPKIWRK